MTPRRRLMVAAAAVLLLGIGAFFLQRTLSEPSSECDLVTQTRDQLLAAADESSGIAVIGDSYTQGVKLSGPAVAWPAVLGNLLGVPVAVDGMSSTGFTTAGFCEGEPVTYGDRLADHPPKAETVIVQGGVNDALSGDPNAVEEAAADLLDNLEDVPTVVLVGPPAITAVDWSAVDTVDRALREAADDAGRIYVPLIDAGIPLTDDGIHPTEAGQAQIAQLVAAALGA